MVREDKELLQKFSTYIKKIGSEVAGVYDHAEYILDKKNEILLLLKDDSELTGITEEILADVETFVVIAPRLSNQAEDLSDLIQFKILDEL